MKAAPITDRKAERPKNFGLYQKFYPSFISWNQQSPEHATQRRRPLAAQVPRSHSRATNQSSEFRTPALDRGIFLLFFPPYPPVPAGLSSALSLFVFFFSNDYTSKSQLEVATAVQYSGQRE
jgi:hypothetical protein